MSGRPVQIAYEQAVYGSFPFWDKGYAVLAKSDNCRDEWLSDFKQLCQSLGQPPSEAQPLVNKLILAKKLPSGPWLVCQGSAQGCDDRGRPGAWAFHGLFLNGRDYRRAGASPFVFQQALNDQFQPDLQLKSSIFTVQADLKPSNSNGLRHDLASWITRGRSLRILADTPDQLQCVAEFWHQLPPGLRSKRSLTTWLFRPDADFHLAAVSPHRWPADQPHLSRNIWAVTFQDAMAVELQATGPKTSRFKFSKKQVLVASAAGLCLISALRWCLTGDSNRAARKEPADLAQATIRDELPAPHPFQAELEPANVRLAIEEQLADWCERLSLEHGQELKSPCAQAALIANAVRYNGPPVRDQMAVADFQRYAGLREIPDSPLLADSPSTLYAITLLSWSLRAPELQSRAAQLKSPADVRLWFNDLRTFLLPDMKRLDTRPIDTVSQSPEFAEFRLHLNRLARLGDQ